MQKNCKKICTYQKKVVPLHRQMKKTPISNSKKITKKNETIMKATIYKNDNFETVGLKVEHADVTLFRWGATCEQYYYTKTINADPYTAEVLDLIKLERMRQYYEWDFSVEVCETNMDARNMAKRKSKKDLATFIKIDKERAQELEQAIQNKIRQIAK